MIPVTSLNCEYEYLNARHNCSFPSISCVQFWTGNLIVVIITVFVVKRMSEYRELAWIDTSVVCIIVVLRSVYRFFCCHLILFFSYLFISFTFTGIFSFPVLYILPFFRWGPYLNMSHFLFVCLTQIFCKVYPCLPTLVNVDQI